MSAEVEDAVYDVTITTVRNLRVYGTSPLGAVEAAQRMYDSGDACASSGDTEISAVLSPNQNVDDD